MQKFANLVDLENPEKMSIWSLSELSIQPRTSLSKFEGDFISSFIRLLSQLEEGFCGAAALAGEKRDSRTSDPWAA